MACAPWLCALCLRTRSAPPLLTLSLPALWPLLLSPGAAERDLLPPAAPLRGIKSPRVAVRSLAWRFPPLGLSALRSLGLRCAFRPAFAGLALPSPRSLYPRSARSQREKPRTNEKTPPAEELGHGTTTPGLGLNHALPRHLVGAGQGWRGGMRPQRVHAPLITRLPISAVATYHAENKNVLQLLTNQMRLDETSAI